MRCDQFQQRMDQLLDQRRDVSEDAALSLHAKTCESCSQHLQVWSKIDETVGCGQASGSDRNQAIPTDGKNARLAVGILATAAAVLLMVSAGSWFFRPKPEQTQTIAAAIVADPDSATNQNPAPLGPPQSNLQQAPQLAWQSGQWWSAVSDDQWVNRTIPAVNSVRIGVAPIGRSMRQAFAILMIQTNSTPISPSSVTPDAPPAEFQEQTSSENPSKRFHTLA